MIPLVTVQRALRDRVEADLANLWGCEIPPGDGSPGTGHGPATATKRPAVYAGRIPPKASLDEDGERIDGGPDAPPLVTVEIADCQDTIRRDTNGTVRVRIRAWAYSDRQDGHTEALQIVDHLRQSLLARAWLDLSPGHRITAGDRMTTRLPDAAEQPEPYWVAEIEYTYRLPQIMRTDEALP